VAAARELSPWGPPRELREAEWVRYPDLSRPGDHPGAGWGWSLAGLAVLTLVVAAGVALWPDFVRYMKIRNM
jgi:hypothetical protein